MGTSRKEKECRTFSDGRVNMRGSVDDYCVLVFRGCMFDACFADYAAAPG